MAVPMKKVWVYDPFEELRRMQKEMDEMFANIMERRPAGGELVEWGARAPLSDVEDKGDSFVLKAELPGMEKEDIKIEVSDNSVSVSAERKSAQEEKKKSYYYCERTYSGYRRSFALPQKINPEAVEAEYKNGVLTVSMKKLELPAPKKKEIKPK